MSVTNCFNLKISLLRKFSPINHISNPLPPRKRTSEFFQILGAVNSSDCMIRESSNYPDSLINVHETCCQNVLSSRTTTCTKNKQPKFPTNNKEEVTLFFKELDFLESLKKLISPITIILNEKEAHNCFSIIHES